ncbi:MAG: nucleotide exchange factor GrpE [Bacteroidales bacterium]|jgi:molecular chaperone GrpE|nr:nucleotide exchange factor GrpE [Bacteroidales bacterium]
MKQNEKIENEELKKETEMQEPTSDAAEQAAENEAEKPVEEADPLAEMEAKLAAQKDQYLRLMADFDNYRKNQLKKTNDLLTYGGEEAFKKLLPIIDDFERAVEHNEKTEDVAALREGFKLIYGKLRTYLEQNGVTVIPAAAGDEFDENVHEAITMCPAPAPELKGKLVDCATKGYKYKDKVIRIAKVVVGE